MIISKGKVFLNNIGFVDADINICDGVISNIIQRESQDKSQKNSLSEDKKKLSTAGPIKASADIDTSDIDASDLYIIPGLVDIHLHGCMGHDFCQGTYEAFDAICQYELSQGVTSICPATMTIAKDELRQIFSNVRAYTASSSSRFPNNAVISNESSFDSSTSEYSAKASIIQGITMEGPFLSMGKKGAQNAYYLCKPDVDFFAEAQELSGGLIRQVAVAPEVDKDFAFIKEVTDRHHTVCSLAHSEADYDTARRAFEAGANHVTHLYNGMNPMTHRSPGIPGAAYDNKEVFVELITDGIHISPSIVRMTFDMFGSERICMISDSMEATGLSDGNYSLGGQAVIVKGKVATLADGTIAGSASSLMDCLKVAVNSMGIPLADAVKSCTSTPARSLGIDDRCGRIEVGRDADLLLLDESLNIIHIIKSGRLVY